MVMRPLDPQRIYTIKEMLQDVHGRSSAWWSRNCAKLYAEGFPRPICSVGHPRWAGIDLIAWRDRPKLDSNTPLPKGGNVRNLLAERARRIAGRVA